MDREITILKSKKLEIIKQDLTLVTINKDNALQVRRFNQCYDGGDTLSVKVDGLKCYLIKENKYYVCGDYALVSDESFLDLSINKLCNNRIDSCKKQIKQCLKYIQIKKGHINELKQNIR